MNFPCQTGSQSFLFNFQIEVRLKVHPKLRGNPKKPPEPKSRVRGNGSFPVYNLVDPSRGDMNVFGKAILADTQRIQKLFKQNFPRMHRRQFIVHSHHSLMIIDYFDVVRMTVIPAKADAPLLVDPDTVLPPPTSCESLQSIPRRNPEISKIGG